MSGSINPFQAPESDGHQEPTLSDDAEFLISGSEILCRDSVELPPVCIARGTTENLQRREATLYSTNWVFTGILVAVLIAGTIPLAAVFADGGLLLVAVVVISLNLMSWLLPRLDFPGTRKIHVSWYVSEAHVRLHRWISWIIRGVIVSIMAAVGFLVGQGEIGLPVDTPFDGPGMGLLFGTAMAIITFRMQTERRIQFQGRRRWGPHKGLYSLSGHSRRFSDKVEALIHSAF